MARVYVLLLPIVDSYTTWLTLLWLVWQAEAMPHSLCLSRIRNRQSIICVLILVFFQQAKG
jgi:hypothetical protein